MRGPEGKEAFGRSKLKWEHNIIMDPVGVDWIDMALDRDMWWMLANVVMDFQVP